LSSRWHGRSTMPEVGRHPHAVADRRQPDLQAKLPLHGSSLLVVGPKLTPNLLF
jgi:hypothetical protein